MALSLDYTIQAGATVQVNLASEQPTFEQIDRQTLFPSAYWKVTGVDEKQLLVQLCVYDTQAMDRLLATPIYSLPNLNDQPGHQRQAYLHLKTLPEFADAVDC